MTHAIMTPSVESLRTSRYRLACRYESLSCPTSARRAHLRRERFPLSSRIEIRRRLAALLARFFFPSRARTWFRIFLYPENDSRENRARRSKIRGRESRCFRGRNFASIASRYLLARIPCVSSSSKRTMLRSFTTYSSYSIIAIVVMFPSPYLTAA